MAEQEPQPKKRGRHPRREERYTDREVEAMDLRRQHLSYRKMAQVMGVTPKRAYELVQQGLRKYNEDVGETAQELKEIMLARLDEMAEKAFERAVANGNEKDVQTVLRIMERQAKLLGLEVDRRETTMKWETLVAESLTD